MSTIQHPSFTRTIDGVDGLPVEGTWDIDPGHTEVAFIGRHFMMTKVRGRFNRVTGRITIGETPADSAVDVVIEMASLDSGSTDRDEHLRSSDFLDVDRFPDATFRSTAVAWNGTSGIVHGVLTMVGVARPVALDVHYLGAAADPWGGQRAMFSAATEVNREDWGLTWNMALEAGGVLVSKKIRIEIEVESVRAR